MYILRAHFILFNIANLYHLRSDTMSPFTKDQLQHLDLPEEFRNFENPLKPSPPGPSWDLILLGITLLLVVENNNV